MVAAGNSFSFRKREWAYQRIKENLGGSRKMR